MISFLKPDPEQMRLKGDLNGLIRLVRTSPDPLLRAEAALALGRMQTPRAVPELINALYDKNVQVVTAASEALVYVGRPAVRSLVETYNTADEMVSKWIHHTLYQIGSSAVNDILASVPLLNEAGEERVSYTLLSFGNDALLNLIAAMGDTDKKTSRLAEILIETTGRQAVPFLIQELDNPDEDIRARSASLLILFGDQIVLDLLASCGQDCDDTRELKFYIINEIGSPALEPLYTALKDTNPVTSSMALKVFMDLGDAAIVPLIRGIFDDQQETRVVSENALIRIGEPVVTYLIKEIPLHTGSERDIIISTIIRIGEPAIPHLTHALFDPSADISRTVSEIIPRFGTLSASYLLDVIDEKNDDATTKVSRIFKELGRTAFPAIEDAITTRNTKTALFAIHLLREIDPVRALDPLIESLSNHDEQVRQTAKNELINLGDMAIPRFIQILSSGNDTEISLADTALRQMGVNAAPHLADALADPLTGDKSRITSIIRDIGDEAIFYLIPMITPENQGRNEALILIREHGIRVIPYLLDALKTAAPDLNHEIRTLLTSFFEQEPGEFIDHMMGQPSGISLDVIKEIISSSPEQVISHLTGLMHSPDKTQAKQAGELLVSFGEQAIEPIISALRKEEDDEHKLVLTQFLIRMGPAAVPALISTFKDPSIAIYSVAALGTIGKPAVPSLIALLHNPDEDMVNYAGLSLARIGLAALPDLLELFKTDTTLVPLIGGILARMGGTALPRLLEEFKTLETSGEQGSERGLLLMSMILEISLTDAEQMHALFKVTDEKLIRMLTGILVSKGTPVIDPVIVGLLSWEKPTPSLVVQTFMSMKSEVINRVHQVMNQLPDRDLRRIPLIRLLGAMKDPSSSTIIFSAMNDSDQRIRVAAILELGKFGLEALAHLTQAMDDENTEVRVAAIEAMGDIGLPALDQLLTALKDENGDIRAAAIKGIGKIGEPAKFMLIQALNDSDRQVRRDVVRLLDTIRWVPKYTTDRLSYLFAREDWDALVKIGPPGTDILIRGMQDKDPEINEASREALRKIRSSLPPV
jgi:HEAT repeat protein